MIYVTGDTHGRVDIQKLNTNYFPEQKTMTKDDFVIIVGDFGHIWFPKNSPCYKENDYWLNNYFTNKKNFTTLFLDGNHENFDLLNSYPVEIWNGGKVHRINDSVIHLMRGQVYTINGKTFFTFGGARSVDKEWRKTGVSWWAQEEPTHSELEEGLDNLNKVNWKVDYVLTHTCPKKVHDFIGKTFIKLQDTGDVEVLLKYFDELDSKLEYSKWYFGHYHLDFTLPTKTEALFQRVMRIE